MVIKIISSLLFLLLVASSAIAGMGAPAGQTGPGGTLPASGNRGNMLFDSGNTASWLSLTPAGDLTPGASNGLVTVAGINGTPINGGFTPSTANQTLVTNGSNQLVPASVAVDTLNAVHQIPEVSATGTPNTYTGVLHTVNHVLTTPTALAVNATAAFTNFLFVGAAETVQKISFEVSTTGTCAPVPTFSLVDCGTTDPTGTVTTTFCSSTTPITSSGASNITITPSAATAAEQIYPITWTGTLTLTSGHYYAGRVTGAGTSCANEGFQFDIQSLL